MNSIFNEEHALFLLKKYPELTILLKSGLLSRKIVRDAMHIDKYEMDDLFLDLLRIGAIRTYASNTFRGSREMMLLLSKLDTEDNEKQRDVKAEEYLTDEIYSKIKAKNHNK